MTMELLELAADVLGPLVEEVVFVGGATVGVLTTDPAAPPARPTDDIDVVVEAANRGEYEQFAERLRARGLGEDSSSAVICRWRHHTSPIILDVMPTNERVFGFANRWYPLVMSEPIVIELPSGASVAVVSPALLLATKLEAFADRGASDPMSSRDLADIVMLIDRRVELVDEVGRSESKVRAFVGEQLRQLRGRPDRNVLVASHLLPDEASQARASLVVWPRIDQLCELGA